MTKRSRNNAALRNRSGDLGEGLSEIATLAADLGRGQLGKLTDTAEKTYQDAKEHLVTWEETLESYVRQRPVKSLLAAAGIGIVLAMIWRRR